ncbi:MAG: radical SAM protein, partial [bacterium]|nr:radical SAM protein [bacterium]
MALNKKNKERKKKIIDYLCSRVEDQDTSPSILQLCLTTACQLNCSYCKMGMISPPRTMSLSTLKKSIDFLLTSRADVITFQLFGGEPLLQWDLVRKGIEYFRQKSRNRKKTYEVSLTTNAVLLTGEKINFFKNAGVDFDIVFSFDGVKKTQNANRPPFRKALAGRYFNQIIRNLKELIAS